MEEEDEGNSFTTPGSCGSLLLLSLWLSPSLGEPSSTSSASQNKDLMLHAPVDAATATVRQHIWKSQLYLHVQRFSIS